MSLFLVDDCAGGDSAARRALQSKHARWDSIKLSPCPRHTSGAKGLARAPLPDRARPSGGGRGREREVSRDGRRERVDRARTCAREGAGLLLSPTTWMG